VRRVNGADIWVLRRVFIFFPPAHPPFRWLQKPALARFLLLNAGYYVHKACQFCTCFKKSNKWDKINVPANQLFNAKPQAYLLLYCSLIMYQLIVPAYSPPPPYR